MEALGCWLVTWVILGLIGLPPATTAIIAPPNLTTRLWVEPGLRRLIQMAEVALSNRKVSRCTSKLDVNETSVFPPERPLCLSEFVHQPPTRMKSFREYVEKAVFYTPAGFGTLRARMLGGSYPYVSTSLFRSVCDNVVDAGSSPSRPKDPTSLIGDFPNRSLIYCHLPHDESVLWDQLQNGPARQHFFLVVHRDTTALFPLWLLEHPRVLKVFGQCADTGQHHPKLVHIPLGMADPQLPTLLHLVRMKAARRKLDVAPARLLMTPVDPMQSRATLLANFPDVNPALLSHFARWVEMARSKFIALTMTHRLDSVDVAEVHTLGRVPLIAGSECDENRLQLPCLEVQDWTALSPDGLQAEWDMRMQNPSPRYNLERLWAPWWLAFMLRECLSVP